MHTGYIFPFGEPVLKVVQQDCTPKKVFVLGVYASAVHARWLDKKAKQKCQAMAIASEPYIFWRGEDAETIISRIKIPEALGHLEPAQRDYNGPSGITLDNLYLEPLRLTRDDTWLCDLVPYSCLNDSQKAAIERSYLPIANQFNLPTPTRPPVPTIDNQRRQEILAEILESQAEVVILLGNDPIQSFLNHFDSRWKQLSDFGDYGKLHETKLGEKIMRVLPLAHPRQTAKLGLSSEKWYTLHQNWLKLTAPLLEI